VVLQAQAELERRKRRRRTEPLLDFVHDVTPRWEPPVHLKAICDLFERAEHEEVRALVSVPPQHGKTETILHGAAQLLLRHPRKTVGYVSYAADFAHSKSRLARDYALRAGVELRADSQSVAEWRTTENGGMIATGVGGPFTGHGIQLLVIDDPHKNRIEADSPVMREHVRGWASSTAFTRVHPGGSVIVVHTRWHPDDLIGSLSKQTRRDGSPSWEVINLPAIDTEGRPLWPSQRPVSFIEQQEDALGVYDFASLYLGAPRPRGDALFQGGNFYARLPDGCRYAIGVDFAYTAKTHADYSVAVVLAEKDDAFYVVEVRRAQVRAPDFASTLRDLNASYPGAPMFAYTGGQESGILDFLDREGVRIKGEPAPADKFNRAQATSAAWNRGKVFLPRHVRTSPEGEVLESSMPTWATAFVTELGAFTGVSDKNDDQVDALVAAHDTLVRQRPHESPPEDALVTYDFESSPFEG
jgi:phage terminase large subunit-like protein